ncbi:MAG: pseudoazurin [Thalassotalea sp.]|nr:pseudoazurin [Thalassotalea sp.]
MRIFSTITAILFTSTTLFSLNVDAKNHEVKLLTADGSGQTMVMSPGFLKVEKGDTVTFVPSDVTHNVESMSIPDSAKPFSSEMGKSFTVTFSEEGVYLYKCTPHFALGMLGVIQAGNANNLEKVKSDWTKESTGVVMNKERVEQYLSQIK